MKAAAEEAAAETAAVETAVTEMAAAESAAAETAAAVKAAAETAAGGDGRGGRAAAAPARPATVVMAAAEAAAQPEMPCRMKTAHRSRWPPEGRGVRRCYTSSHGNLAHQHQRALGVGEYRSKADRTDARDLGDGVDHEVGRHCASARRTSQAWVEDEWV